MGYVALDLYAQHQRTGINASPGERMLPPPTDVTSHKKQKSGGAHVCERFTGTIFIPHTGPIILALSVGESSQTDFFLSELPD